MFRYGGASGWSEVMKVLAMDGSDNDHFGISLSIYDTSFIVGASGDNVHGIGSGTAHTQIKLYIYCAL